MDKFQIESKFSRRNALPEPIVRGSQSRKDLIDHLRGGRSPGQIAFGLVHGEAAKADGFVRSILRDSRYEILLEQSRREAALSRQSLGLLPSPPRVMAAILNE